MSLEQIEKIGIAFLMTIGAIFGTILFVGVIVGLSHTLGVPLPLMALVLVPTFLAVGFLMYRAIDGAR